jgi:Holliday junction resolvasome RuvABC endonuclease subunit
MSSVILVLDPALSTGYCLVSVSDPSEKAIIYKYGFIDVDNTSDFSADWCLNLQVQLREICINHSVTHIAVENFFFSKKSANGSTVNIELRTAIYILARTLGLEYTILGISEWKKFVSGRTTPTKEQKKKWGAQRAKKLAIQEALWLKYGFKFPNHSLSKKTGKPVSFRLDVVDAVAQAVYFVEIYLHCTEIQMKVHVPKDIEVRGKEAFCYENV